MKTESATAASKPPASRPEPKQEKNVETSSSEPRDEVTLSSGGDDGPEADRESLAEERERAVASDDPEVRAAYFELEDEMREKYPDEWPRVLRRDQFAHDILFNEFERERQVDQRLETLDDPLVSTTLHNSNLPALAQEAVLNVREQGGTFESSADYRAAVQAEVDRLALEALPSTPRPDLDELAAESPNLFPALLAEARDVPHLEGGPLALELDGADDIRYETHDGQVYGVVNTSLNSVVPDEARRAQIAEDYAASDQAMTLRIPVDRSLEDLPLEQQQELLEQAIEENPRVTAFVHGFQSTKAIWDSTAYDWLERDGPSVGIAFDGYGTDGSALSDGSIPYTPKQYGFQLLEGLDAMGVLANKDLTVVGQSMGGAAAGEMAVALDRADHQGRADFFMLAPAATPDSTPFFEEGLNGLVVGDIYVPAGSSDLLGGVVQWVDEKVPALSRLVIDSPWFLDLGDSAPEIRDQFANYYRELDPSGNAARRDRANENMLGMLNQDGLDAEALNQAAARDNFNVTLVSFGDDRLVDPAEVQSLDGDAIDAIAFETGNHNALFDEPVLEQILNGAAGS